MTVEQIADYEIRRWFIQKDQIAQNENYESDGEPVVKIAVGVVLKNPYANQFSEDLSLLVANSDQLGAEIGRRAVEAMNGVAIESYGKGCVVGVNGEYEHGNALLTQFAADPIRKAIGGGKAWVPSTGKIGGPGTIIDVPLAFKDDVYVRSHYDTLTVFTGDGPRPDEVMIIWTFASRGRLHARLGGLRLDEALAQN